MIRSLCEIVMIVCLRFPLPIRVWALTVASVNLASLLFLGTIEGMVVLLALCIALLIMMTIQMQLGFVRLLGVGHATWFVMLPWLFMRLPLAVSNPALYRWLVTLLVLNSICMIVDAVDVVRYICGNKKPHYSL